MNVVFSSGAFGASPYDSEVDKVMRAIAKAVDPSDENWSEKYGADADNDVFMMRRYCWCEEDSCKWCSEDACGCAHPNPWYEWDGVWITWDDAQLLIPPYEMSSQVAEYGTPEYEAAGQVLDAAMRYRDEHLKQIWPARTHTCEPSGLMSDRTQGGTWLPSQTAPNFWHKPSGFKVWWYKYIGRSVETVGELPSDLLDQCLAALR